MKNYSKIMSIFLFLSIFDPIVSMQKEDIENTKGIQEAKERAFNQAAKIKLYQLKCQIEEIFKDNDYDIACDKCSEILKSVVFNKILFDKIGEELINFKDKCKVSAFKLDKVKKVQYQIRAIFMNSPYESAYPQAIKFLKLCLSKDSELSNFKKHLFDSVEEFKKRALSAEINRVKTILINIFQEISYDRACDEAADLLQLELSTNKYLMEFSNDFINFIEECKDQTINLSIKDTKSKLENIFQSEDSKESYDKALHFLEEVLSIKPELVQFKDDFLGFIEECKSNILNLEVKRIEAALENIFQDNDYEEACKKASEHLSLSLITNSDLNQLSTNLIKFKKECKRKALLTAQLKNILEGPYSKEKEAEALELIIQGANPNVLVKYENLILNYTNRPMSILLKIILSNKFLGILSTLIKHGADLNAKDCEGNTVLMKAAEKDSSYIAMRFLYAGSEVNAKNNYGDTVLMKCIEKGHIALLEELINRKVDINIKNNQGNTPLMVAVKYGSYEIVKILLDKGANVNEINNEGNSVLIKAVDTYDVKLVKLFLEQGVDVNTQNNHGNTALISAIYGYNPHNSNAISVIKLLLKFGANLDVKNNHGENALSLVKKKNNLELLNFFNNITENSEDDKSFYYMRELLQNFRNILNKDDNIFYILEFVNKALSNKETKLFKEHFINFAKNYLRSHFAYDYLRFKRYELNAMLKNILENNYTDLAEIEVAKLIFAGANPNLMVNHEGREVSLLVKIAKSGNFKNLIKLLVFYGADINAVDDKGCNILMLLIINNIDQVQREIGILDDFIKLGIDIKAQDKEGWTALMYATMYGKWAIIEHLIELGADINVKNLDGDNALIIAGRWNHEGILTRLLNQKALIDINANLKDGLTILMWAAKNNKTKIVDIILNNKSVNLNAQDNNGYTALMHAAENNHQDVVQMLLETLTSDKRRIHQGIGFIGTIFNKMDINIQDKNGATALIKAIINDNEEVVTQLLEIIVANQPYIINVQDKNGNTLLMYAIQTKKEWLVKKLLTFDFLDFYARNNKDQSARDLALNCDSNMLTLIDNAIENDDQKKKEEWNNSYLNPSSYKVYKKLFDK